MLNCETALSKASSVFFFRCLLTYNRKTKQQIILSLCCQDTHRLTLILPILVFEPAFSKEDCIKICSYEQI